MNKYLFESINQPWQSYVLGFLYSDGYISNREVGIKLSSSDLQILTDIQEKVKQGKISHQPSKEFKHKNGVYTSKPTSALRIYNVKMIRNLAKFGMTPKKTFKIRFPENLPFISHFIRGYFDGDGCITADCKKYGKVKIAGNDDFILNLKKHFDYGHIYKQGKISIFCIFKQSDIQLFFEYIYDDADIFLKRKMDKFNNLGFANV